MSSVSFSSMVVGMNEHKTHKTSFYYYFENLEMLNLFFLMPVQPCGVTTVIFEVKQPCLQASNC